MSSETHPRHSTSRGEQDYWSGRLRIAEERMPFWKAIAADPANRHIYIDWLIENELDGAAGMWLADTDEGCRKWAQHLVDDWTRELKRAREQQ